MKNKPNPGGGNQVVGQNTNRSTKSGNTKNTSYGTNGGSSAALKGR